MVNALLPMTLRKSCKPEMKARIIAARSLALGPISKDFNGRSKWRAMLSRNISAARGFGAERSSKSNGSMGSAPFSVFAMMASITRWVVVNSLHPGAVGGTGLNRGLGFPFTAILAIARHFMKSIPQRGGDSDVASASPWLMASSRPHRQTG
ncbi:MAG: hypothetical protein WA510_33370 [Acidobacteriaceae bacterium]